MKKPFPEFISDLISEGNDFLRGFGPKKSPPKKEDEWPTIRIKHSNSGMNKSQNEEEKI